MKIVIIEDDAAAADDIIKLLGKITQPVTAIKIVGSITEAESFFKSGHSTNLIFSNIKINGSNSFTIFKQVKINTPVIYYADDTAHAIEAYQSNAIGYMIKPLTRNAIADSVEIYKSLHEGFNKQGNHTNEFIASK